MSVQGDKSIVDFVRKFKSISVIKSRQYGFEGRIYQNRFYDHFIRKEDGLNNTIMYVLNNPVRKGLVDNWEDFPYSGFCL
jgi:REP element-mobilizing transposase RayT